MRIMRWAAGAALAAGIALAPAMTSAQTLKVIMHADVKIIDPYWTTAYIVRNYGYMVYDTLLAVDDKLRVQPQMLEGWKISDDKLTYTFTLRDGLKFHDGQPVTAEDCVASLNRWAPKDAMGQKLMSFTKELKAVDDKTFTLTLKEPYGLVLETLGKPSSLVPFIMPKRIAQTPGNAQIGEPIGSGPFVFRKDLWRPGEKAIFDKFKDYKPRPEPASSLAGGKVVKVDRVEWLNITDPQTIMNALISGDIDMIDQPVIELLPLLEGNKDIEVVELNPLGAQLVFRFNTLHKPFDNPRIRQAAVYALNQKDFLVAGYTNPKFYKECKALFICGTPLATDKGFEDKLESNFAKSKEILKQEGYDGAPVVLLYATDTNTGRLTPILKALLERGGFTVDMQAMDWNTVVSRRTRKEPPSAGGWSGFMTTWVSADVLDPVMSAFVGANCEKAAIGWPCDAKIEELRDAFAKASDLAKRKEIAEAVQVRVSEYPTHVQLGQFYLPSAIRTSVTGLLQAPAPVFWNVSKKE
ncbi:MAG: ABC transporter substrate-binding protein [Pseudomonadota bacterium]